MVQFNLLPDIKLQYIKTQRVKHLVTFIATIVSVVSVGLLLFSMFFVYIVQGQILGSVDKNIKKENAKLTKITDINKILTVQNQLDTLTSLHEGKPAASRLFAYLQQTTPARVSLSQLQLDFSASTITLGGNASSLDDIKIYTDTLKAAAYSTGADSAQKKAFSDVVLSSFSRTDKGANFTITAKAAPDLFDTRLTVQLSASTATSTDSVFEEER